MECPHCGKKLSNKEFHLDNNTSVKEAIVEIARTFKLPMRSIHIMKTSKKKFRSDAHILTVRTYWKNKNFKEK